MNIDKVYLVGFMATGKSTVGRHLAARLGWRLEDIDQLIEAHERCTVAETFSTHGEAHFRLVEKKMLAVVRPLRHVVVATGGGTFADADNRAAINVDGASVWIDVPLPELIARIPLDGRRPLASNRPQLEQLFAARTDAYRMAHVRIDASRSSASMVADRILETLHSLPPSIGIPVGPDNA